MAKRTRTNEWYRVLIKKVGTTTVEGKKFWELAEETDAELGLPALPIGSHHCVLEKLKRSDLFDYVFVDKIHVLISIKDVDKLLEEFSDSPKTLVSKRKSALKKKKTRVSKEAKDSGEITKDPNREAFIKYFRLLRCCARSRKKSLDLKTCMEINMLKRIAARHVEYWARVTKEAVPDITLPKVKRSESEIIIEFTGELEEDLLKICDAGQKLYPDYRSTLPSEAFGSEVKVKQLRQQIERKEQIRRATIAEMKVAGDKPSIISEERKRLIFLTLAKLFKDGYSTLSEIKEYVAPEGFNLSVSELRGILNTCPEIQAIKAESEEVACRGLMHGETEKHFWDSIRDSYGPKNWEKEEIIVSVSMTKGEVSEYLANKTTEIFQIADHGGYGNIFRIFVAKNSRVDRKNMKSLIRRFRKHVDIVITKSEYTEALYREIREEDQAYFLSDPLYCAETGFFQK